MIGVIDYRAGNAPSVGFALERLGLEHRLLTTADGLDACDRLILPGVGAARATLDSLEASNLVEPLSRPQKDALSDVVHVPFCDAQPQDRAPNERAVLFHQPLDGHRRGGSAERRRLRAFEGRAGGRGRHARDSSAGG